MQGRLSKLLFSKHLPPRPGEWPRSRIAPGGSYGQERTVLLACLFTSGCYLTHVAKGQLRLVCSSRSVDSVLADPETTPLVRERLARVGEARAFAADLGLSVADQYTSYAAWPGDRVVTTVVATRPGEVEPAGFSYPFLGTLPYKGFFDPERASEEEDRLRAEGLDVCRSAVRAYSTLGWFDDPVTGPMLRLGEGRLVETIVHELVHATVYLPDAADFNEGVASFLGEEGSVRFYSERGLVEEARRRRDAVRDRRRIQTEVLELRRRVVALYESDAPGPDRSAARERLEQTARDAIAALPLRLHDASSVAHDARLNDACLALAGTYAEDRPAFERALEARGGDLRAFVEALRTAADSPTPRASLLGN